MSARRPGLQAKWSYVVNSLQEIIPSYEVASSRISLFADHQMRVKATSSVVCSGQDILDLGSGPGTMSRLVQTRGGHPVLLDASKAMLKASDFRNRVQATFEWLPFRDGAFDGAVCGFALRDARDLDTAVREVCRVLRGGGRFGLCDLGKPDSIVKMVALACYLRIAPSLIGLVTAGRSGLRYGSIYDTYVLTLRNSQLSALLSKSFGPVELDETQLGGAIVVTCTRCS